MGFYVSEVVPSAARTGNGVSNGFNVGDNDKLIIALFVTAAGGVSPVLSMKVQWSMDGTLYFDSEPPTGFADITGVKNIALAKEALGPYSRLSWTMTGTAPSFTFSASKYYRYEG